MGVRFFYGLLFLYAMNVSHCHPFLSHAHGTNLEEDYDTGDNGDFSDLYGESTDVPTIDLDQKIHIPAPQDETTQKIEAILQQFGTVIKAEQYNKSLKSQNDAWVTIHQKNLKSIIPTSLPIYNFTEIPSATSPVESLMLSNVAALAFCKGRSDPTKRALKVRTISGSIFKKGLQVGSNALSGNKQAFTLPPLSISSTTCANVRQEFCQNVCTKGLCGADPLYGAVCVRACGGQDFASNTKIQQCLQEFSMRYVHTIPGALSNPCAVKALQLAQGGTAQKIAAAVSGTKESYALADRCAAIVTPTNVAALGPIGTLCAKLFQTCSLNQQDRQNLSILLTQMQRTGQVPTTPVSVGIPAYAPLGALPPAPPAFAYGNVPPPGYPVGVPVGYPGGYPGGMPGMSPYGASPVGNIQPPRLLPMPQMPGMGGPMPYGGGYNNGGYNNGGNNWGNGNNNGGGNNNWGNGNNGNNGGGGYNNGGNNWGNGNNNGGGYNNGNNNGGGNNGGNGNNNGGGFNNSGFNNGNNGGGGQFGGGGGGNDDGNICNKNSNSYDPDNCNGTPYNGPGPGNGGNGNNNSGGFNNGNGNNNGVDPCDPDGGYYNPSNPLCNQ